MDRIAEMRADGTTVVFASHSLEQVQEQCDRAIWLQGGTLRVHAEAGEVIEEYENAMRSETVDRTPRATASSTTDGLELGRNRLGSQEATIDSVWIAGHDADLTIRSGAAMDVRMEIKAPQPIISPIAVVTVRSGGGWHDLRGPHVRSQRRPARDPGGNLRGGAPLPAARARAGGLCCRRWPVRAIVGLCLRPPARGAPVYGRRRRHSQGRLRAGSWLDGESPVTRIGAPARTVLMELNGTPSPVDWEAAPLWRVIATADGVPCWAAWIPGPGRLVDPGSFTEATLADAREHARELALTERFERLLGISEVVGPARTVSVVVCTHRRPTYLPGLLDALTRLDPPPHEVIVVDNDPGDDGCEDLVAAYGARYVREDRRGLDRARTAGLRAATGELVAFTDDDCVPAPGWLARLDRHFADPTVHGVTGPAFAWEFETPSQLRFELEGGFNRGFRLRRFDWMTHPPCGSGSRRVRREHDLPPRGAPRPRRPVPARARRRYRDTNGRRHVRHLPRARGRGPDGLRSGDVRFSPPPPGPSRSASRVPRIRHGHRRHDVEGSAGAQGAGSAS